MNSVPLARRAAPLAAAAVLAACGTYEPPSPGLHIAPGEKRAEVRCDFGQHTGLRIATYRCVRTENLPDAEQQARELLDNNRIYQPRLP